jgi:hypothetical protein
MSKFPVLEYLHPDGIASTCVVLGNNCPDGLRPNLQGAADGKADLFIFAPSAAECNLKSWLEASAKSMSNQLSEDGVGYVLVSRRWRGKVMRLLHRAGLVPDMAFWHFPDWYSSQFLVPIDRKPARFAVDVILPGPSFKRTLARQMLRYSGTRQLLTLFWHSTGMTVRRPGARPLFEWLFQVDPQRPWMGNAMVRTSWRGSNGASIAYGFFRRDVIPSVVAKTVAVGTAAVHLDREAQVLEKLGSGVRCAGAQVPEIIGRQQNSQRSSLLLSYLPGQAASDLLKLNPSMFSPVMMRIVHWLDHWHRTTAILQPLTWEQIEQALLVPLDRLAASVKNADRYRERLVTQGQTIVGYPIPMVASHNDLTMANILLDEHNHLGLVDWETGCPESWPLTDFHYAVTDAVRIAANCSNWLEAFKTCYAQDGAYKALVAAWQERLQSIIGLSSDFAEFCFHACWLHHASNENEVIHPEEPRPFFEIVQWLALHESTFNQK